MICIILYCPTLISQTLTQLNSTFYDMTVCAMEPLVKKLLFCPSLRYKKSYFSFREKLKVENILDVYNYAKPCI